MKSIFKKIDWSTFLKEILRVCIAALSGAIASGCVGFPFIKL